MKKLLLVLLVVSSFAANAQLTLSEKATLAQVQTFRERIYQGMFSKANFWLTQSPTTLEKQKQINFATSFSKGAAGGIDIKVLTHLWLANYNGVPVLDGQNQPIDTQILNTSALDVVYNLMAGVVSGDSGLPPN